jgi:hypothetical protein
MLWVYALGEGRDQGEDSGAHSLKHPVEGFPLYDGFSSVGIRAEKSRYDLARMEPRAAD